MLIRRHPRNRASIDQTPGPMSASATAIADSCTDTHPPDCRPVRQSSRPAINAATAVGPRPAEQQKRRAYLHGVGGGAPARDCRRHRHAHGEEADGRPAAKNRRREAAHKLPVLRVRRVCRRRRPERVPEPALWGNLFLDPTRDGRIRRKPEAARRKDGPRSDKTARLRSWRVILEHLLRRLGHFLVALLRLVVRLDVAAGHAAPHQRACARIGDID